MSSDVPADRKAPPPKPSSAAQPIKIRLWPAVLIVTLQLAAIYLPQWLAPSTFLHFIGMMFGPILGLLALVIWWLFFSRIPWRDRLVGLTLFVVLGVAMVLVAHQTMMLGSFFFAIPSAATGLVVTLLATAAIPWSTRRWAAAVAILSIAAFWTTIRIDGMDGSMQADLSWRWSPTSEDRFLEDLAKEPNAPRPSKELTIPIEPAAGDWPGFRGSDRDGRLTDARIDADWSQGGPKELWRRRMGPGWSSFTVMGDLLLTQEQRGEREVVICLDANTGQEIWINEIAARFEETVGGPGPRATPTFDGGKLFVQGANGALQCLDPATGKTLWRRDLVEDTGAEVPEWGFSSSPLIIAGKVIVFAGAEGGKSVIAYDRETGEPAWKRGHGNISYSSLHYTSIEETDQILMSSNHGLQSFEPETGEMLWDYKWEKKGMARIVQPLVFDDNSVLIGTGYGIGTRRIDVQKSGDQWTVADRWTSRQLKPYFNDFVEYEGHCYGFDGRIFTCIDLQSGERMWKGGRYGYGQVLLIKDMGLLLVLSEKGKVALLEATPERHKELGSFQALEGKTWNHPVIAHGKLFVRNGEEAACYDVSEK